MNPQEFCTERAAPAGSNLYYAALFHSAPERRVLHTCFAFLEEIRRDLVSATDPTATGRRLLWWREELETRRMTTSAHPLMVELRALPVTPEEIATGLEPSVIAGLEELAGWQPESDAQWHGHCRDLHAGVWQLASRSCSTASVAEVTDRISAIAAITGQLQQVLELAPRTSAGRCPLPHALLQSHGLDNSAGPALLSNPALPVALKGTLSDLRAGLLLCAEPGSASFQALPLYCRVLYLIHLALCEKMLRQPGRLLAERMALTPLRKLWIAWSQRH